MLFALCSTLLSTDVPESWWVTLLGMNRAVGLPCPRGPSAGRTVTHSQLREKKKATLLNEWLGEVAKISHLFY